MAKIGLQIYTIRELANQDLPGAIKLTADAGYDGIEFDAGMLKRADPHQLKDWMEHSNLSVIGLTLLLPELSQFISPMIEYALITNAEWIVMPWVDQEWRKSIQDYENVARSLNIAGQQAAEKGLRFAYHIHGYEFENFGNQSGFDILLANLDPALVELQVDTFWVASGGVDIAAFTEKFIDRIGSFHIKDAASLEPLTDIEVGEGILDIERVVQIGADHDVAWFIVEQEQFTIPQADSIRKSQVNLRKMLNDGEND